MNKTNQNAVMTRLDHVQHVLPGASSLVLVPQAADKFRMIDPTAIIGQVGAGRHEWGAPITVASVQTISRPEHLRALARFGYGLVVIDECFPAGTLIDGKQIEQTKAGDTMTAFNERIQTFSRKRVVSTFCRPAGHRLLRIGAGSIVVVCAPNHPFYTVSGWKAAEHLSTNEEILYAGDDRALCALPTTLPPDDEASARQLQSGEARLLFRGMPTGTRRHDFLRNDGPDQQEGCLRRMTANHPKHKELSRRKVRATLRAMGYAPTGRGGNGKGPIYAQRLLAESLGWPVEYVVKTHLPKSNPMHVPTSYKLGIANPTCLIAIEVDGTSHVTLSRQAQDRKKEQVLAGLGWTVLRFTNQEVMEHLQECVQMVRSITWG